MTISAHIEFCWTLSSEYWHVSPQSKAICLPLRYPTRHWTTKRTVDMIYILTLSEGPHVTGRSFFSKRVLVKPYCQWLFCKFLLNKQFCFHALEVNPWDVRALWRFGMAACDNFKCHLQLPVAVNTLQMMPIQYRSKADSGLNLVSDCSTDICMFSDPPKSERNSWKGKEVRMITQYAGKQSQPSSFPRPKQWDTVYGPSRYAPHPPYPSLIIDHSNYRPRLAE
jgi:hypothetical protein